MRVLYAAGVVAALTCAAVADPSDPLAAADPGNTSGWHPPPAPTSGLRHYRPVEAGDWLELNRRAGSKAMPAMDDMPGMGAHK